METPAFGGAVSLLKNNTAYDIRCILILFLNYA